MGETTSADAKEVHRSGEVPPSIDVQHYSLQSQCRKDFPWLKRFEDAWPVIAVARTTMAEIAKIRKTEEKKKATVVIDQYEAESLTYALMS